VSVVSEIFAFLTGFSLFVHCTMVTTRKELRIPSIAKLKGTEDYKSWTFSMMLWLKRGKRWCYVNNKVPAEKWEAEVDEETLCDIGLMVDTSVYVHLHDVKTSKEALDILAKTFPVTGRTGRYSLMRRLHAMKLENYNSISAYICEIMRLTQQLEDTGKVVDDDIGFIMLNGLTPEDGQIRPKHVVILKF
jgi:hypothetical protein